MVILCSFAIDLYIFYGITTRDASPKRAVSERRVRPGPKATERGLKRHGAKVRSKGGGSGNSERYILI